MKHLLFLILFFVPVLAFAQEEREMTMPELVRALEATTKALKAAESQADKKAQGRNLGKLADIYIDIARQPAENLKPFTNIPQEKKVNLNKSIEYSNRSIEICDAIGDVEQLKESYQNLYTAQKMLGKVGDALSTQGKLQSLKHAILNPSKAKEFERKRVEYESKKREDSIRRQQQLAEERVKEQSQILAQQQKQLEATNQTLTAAEKEKENVNKALQKSQSDLSAEKSVSEEKTRQLTQAEQEKALLAANQQLAETKLKLQQNELQMKDQALEERKKERNRYIIGLVLLLGCTLLIFRSFRLQKKFNQALVTEKKRSEELLLNILPAEVATELIQKGFADAKHFYDVTVLFTDFVNFTTVAESMSPEQLVGELHICFKAFDVILSKYHIEKIKTVGDAYLAVSGLPVANPKHAEDVIAAAIEIRDYMAKRKEELGSGTFGIRLGINSGNVVAGIVGVRKFSYDIWGDTVNIAARMEQNSEEGKINISETTYQLVKHKYPCIHRGKITAKNKGGIDMYYLS